MTSESVKGHVGVGLAAHVGHVQCNSQVVAKGIQVTFGLLDLGKLLVTAGLCVDVDGQLVGSGATDEIREVGELQGRARFLCGFHWCRGCRCGGGVFFQGLRLTAELSEEGAALADRESRERRLRTD